MERRFNVNLTLQLGNKKIINDGETKLIDVAPFVIDDRTFVPIRFIAEEFGYNVDWDEKTETITISDNRCFQNIDDLVYYWAMTYNPASIALHTEFGSSIYKSDKGYYYTKPDVNRDKENPFKIVASVDSSKKLSERIAVIHSHCSIGYNEKTKMCTSVGNKFSQGDIIFSKTYNCDNYVVTPCGRLLRYDLKNNKSDIVISNNVPYDRRAVKQIYENAWNKDVLNNVAIYKSWYKADFKGCEPIVDYFNYLFANDLANPASKDNCVVYDF